MWWQPGAALLPCRRSRAAGWHRRASAGSGPVERLDRVRHIREVDAATHVMRLLTEGGGSLLPLGQTCAHEFVDRFTHADRTLPAELLDGRGDVVGQRQGGAHNASL